MTNVDRYPTWILLLAAIASAIAVALRYMTLDRRSNPRRLWLILLAGWLAVIGLARAGVFVTRSGESITPNEGLLVCADLMAGMLVVSIPVGRAMGRLTDGGLRKLRVGDALQAVLGRSGPYIVVALVLGTMAALLAGEFAVAAELPPPPAVAACQDFTTWILAPANRSMPPQADQGILAQAARAAPPGSLRLHLHALAADVQSAIPGTGPEQDALDGAILSEMDAVNHDCKSVPAAG